MPARQRSAAPDNVLRVKHACAALSHHVDGRFTEALLTKLLLDLLHLRLLLGDQLLKPLLQRVLRCNSLVSAAAQNRLQATRIVFVVTIRTAGVEYRRA